MNDNRYQQLFDNIFNETERIQSHINGIASDIKRDHMSLLNEAIQLSVSELAWTYHKKTDTWEINSPHESEEQQSAKNENIMDPDHEPSEKSQLLTSLKDSVQNIKRFKIGNHLMLRTKLLDRTGRHEKIFVVRQIVWSIEDIVIKGIVVKQLSGINMNMGSLSRYDCQRLHVKYEPGLQIMSMELPWIMVNDAKLKCLKSKTKNNNG